MAPWEVYHRGRAGGRRKEADPGRNPSPAVVSPSGKPRTEENFTAMTARNPIPHHRHRTGLLRREVVQVGFLGALGLPAASAFAAPAPEGPRPERIPARAKGVILVWMP